MRTITCAHLIFGADALPASDPLARAMPALDRAMAAHFEPDCPCC
jgi:hypothetical protein